MLRFALTPRSRSYAVVAVEEDKHGSSDAPVVEEVVVDKEGVQELHLLQV